jgi:hypothetical protein
MSAMLILNRINPDLKKVMIYESGLQAGPPCGLCPQYGLIPNLIENGSSSSTRVRQLAHRDVGDPA